MATKGGQGEDNRLFVDAVLWSARAGAPWRDLPDEFGKWNSVFTRFRRWAKKGVWERIFNALIEDPDFEHLIIDATIVRAHQHAAGAKGGAKIRRSGVRAAARRTKISVSVDGLGNPVRFILTAGNVNDIVQAEALIRGLSFDKLLADKGYDSDRFRTSIAQVGAEAVIPSTRSRSQAIPYDKHIYRDRNLVERFFNKIKHFRRIATRYEKTVLSFASMLFLVGAVIWLR